MLLWLVSLGAAVLVALLQYRGERRRSQAFWGVVALRVLALLLVAALLLDAPVGRAASRTPLVALDASLSWMRGRADSVWTSAVARARDAARGDTVWLVGDSLRPAGASQPPQDAASRVEPAIDRSLSAGRPLVLVTDGEIDDPAAMTRALAGSRVDAPTSGAKSDAALVALEGPRSAVGGDTIEVVARLAAGAAGAAAGSISVFIDRDPLIRAPFDALQAFGERDVRVRVRVPPDGGEHRLLRGVLSAAGDAVPANDTLSAVIDVANTPRAVFVSTAPDQDARFSLEILRGTLAIAVRAFYRVAPGVWRQEPGFMPATEADVKRALADAPIAIMHGDTALFGAPRTATTGSLALLVPAAGDGDEWFAVTAPPSPLSAAFGSIPWDSLPPIALGSAPRGAWTALAARRSRTGRDERSVIAGTEDGRHVAVIAGSGFWRWRFRGGVSADAFAAMWGGVFDWMAGGGDDKRAAIPATAWTRAGDAIAWRRGARRDSVVKVTL
ncbi:MAG TPA: hypothetical protein VE967_04135, partial [Gemmatimonadaceae bacterium]|nr:hypothetical protein [Gemmatimonadaceae bacterium]